MSFLHSCATHPNTRATVANYPSVSDLDQVVVVVGGSLGGLAVTHRLLKHARRRHPKIKVVLVTRNSHFYWNIASVRAIIPGALRRGTDDVLRAIEPELVHRYPSDNVQYVAGRAIRLDPAAKTVSVDTPTYGIRLVHYTHLVLATGADAAVAGMPWKASSTYEALLGDIRETADLVQRAGHVTVAGGGPTGVELAAEIKAAYPAKTVLLLHLGAQLLGGDSTAPLVERELRAMGVELHKGAKATSVDRESRPDGTIVVTLSDGGSFETDAYLSTSGQVPNTRWMPKNLLTDKGYVDVDDCMRVKGVDNIWAVGDVVSKPKAGLLNTEAHVRSPSHTPHPSNSPPAACVAKNIELSFSNKDQEPVKLPTTDVFLCTLGPDRGVGRYGSIPLPSFVVWALKSRSLATERTSKYVKGSMW
ncbi:hypothetical protein PCL_12843 [Purpureocillium lilacinum]|uniref:FAD/NAD(P)-binding domain-containing protein n=1 Tax=Purpureocillium lilacinum TaxID=33203 RepID=A0A2U3E7J6_PURLI|nr:hypothetical protein PCL_12843 [Purpureocillium lilacinum]